MRMKNDSMAIHWINDPLFNSLRDEEEFQQIARDMEANAWQSMKGPGNGWRSRGCYK